MLVKLTNCLRRSEDYFDFGKFTYYIETDIIRKIYEYEVFDNYSLQRKENNHYYCLRIIEKNAASAVDAEDDVYFFLTKEDRDVAIEQLTAVQTYVKNFE